MSQFSPHLLFAKAVRTTPVLPFRRRRRKDPKLRELVAKQHLEQQLVQLPSPESPRVRVLIQWRRNAFN